MPVGRGLSIAALSFLCGTVAAQAQVRDATYRGTLVCGKLAFAQDPTRAAIEVKIAGNDATYSRPVHGVHRTSVLGTETGSGKIDGDKISLAGGWKSDKGSYEATYSGTFVRRRAKHSGAPKRTHEGKSYSRECSGVIKRPLAAFLPKEKAAK
jgi:hypothetical protein